MSFFADIDKIAYRGPDSTDPLSFRYYDADAPILGKPMAEHLRFAVCYWHSFDAVGADAFGVGTWDRPWANGAGGPFSSPPASPRRLWAAASTESMSSAGLASN